MSTKKQEQDKPKNSSMVANEEEMEEHGKIMEDLSTNKKLKEDGKRPDPVQHEKNSKE